MYPIYILHYRYKNRILLKYFSLNDIFKKTEWFLFDRGYEMKHKKIIAFIFSVIFLFGFSTEVRANSLQVEILGKKVSVLEVPILIDGKEIKSETPSFIYVDRTLVPIRLISEEVGLKVGWDKDTNTVTLKGDGVNIELTIDSRQARVNGEPVELDNSSTPRLVKFPGVENAVTMVPLSFLATNLGYEIGYDEGAKAAYMNKEKSNTGNLPSESEETNPGNVGPDLTKVNNISSVKKEFVNGEEYIRIKASKEIDYKLLNLSNPSRVVVDVVEGYLMGESGYNLNQSLGYIENVRVSQFKPDGNYNENDTIARVVFDLNNSITSPELDIKKDGNDLLIKPKKSFWENISFETAGDVRYININALKPTEYKVDYNKDTRKMLIRIPKDNVKLNEGEMELGDRSVGRIKISKDSKDYIVEVNFRRSIEYNVLSKSVDSNIKIEIKRDSNIKNSDRIIVVDPGHGGSDPGAVSANGTKEKDVINPVSEKLVSKLRAKGYTVITTKDTDIYIENIKRAELANENFADIFVSIHANSAAPAANGIEVLYTRIDSNPLKGDQQLDLAKFVLEETVKTTGAVKRSTVNRPKLIVIRETKMPSILVELGFITNPVEEEKLNTPSYQDKLAEGIVNGIDRYFYEY